jgi:hypothetical protein
LGTPLRLPFASSNRASVRSMPPTPAGFHPVLAVYSTPSLSACSSSSRPYFRNITPSAVSVRFWNGRASGTKMLSSVTPTVAVVAFVYCCAEWRAVTWPIS